MANETDSTSTWRSGRLAIALVCALALGLVAIAFTVFKMPYEVAYKNRTEEGVFEKLSVVLFGLAFVVCLGVVLTRRWGRGGYLAIVLLAFALRELDFHMRFTPEKINSIRYWRSGEVGLFEKLFVALVLITVAVALVKLVRGSWRRWLGDLKRGRPYAISVAGMVLFIATSYMLDNQLDMDALDKRQDLVVLFFSLVEETIEVGIPLLASIALIQWATSDCLKPALLATERVVIQPDADDAPAPVDQLAGQEAADPDPLVAGAGVAKDSGSVIEPGDEVGGGLDRPG